MGFMLGEILRISDAVLPEATLPQSGLVALLPGPGQSAWIKVKMPDSPATKEVESQKSKVKRPSTLDLGLETCDYKGGRVGHGGCAYKLAGAPELVVRAAPHNFLVSFKSAEMYFDQPSGSARTPTLCLM
jgi:hypothetical protein